MYKVSIQKNYPYLLMVLLSLLFSKLPWFFSVSIITSPKDFLSMGVQSRNQVIEQDICLSALSSIISEKECKGDSFMYQQKVILIHKLYIGGYLPWKNFRTWISMYLNNEKKTWCVDRFPTFPRFFKSSDVKFVYFPIGLFGPDSGWGWVRADYYGHSINGTFVTKITKPFTLWMIAYVPLICPYLLWSTYFFKITYTLCIMILWT